MNKMEKTLEMHPDYKSVRNRLLAEFPNDNIEGINIERVENYISQEGLIVKQYIIIDRNDLQKVNEIHSSTPLFGSVFDENTEICGTFSPELDLAIVVRDKEMEKSSGAIYTEGLLVHELAHSNFIYQGYLSDNDNDYYIPRVGFCFPQKNSWGWLLEEGWADMHRANYVSQNASKREKNILFGAFGGGREDLNLDMNDTILVTFNGEKMPIPLKYFYIIPGGRASTKSSAYAGCALELLCKKDPSIKSLLTESRSTIDGLRKLAQAIEKITPGLYKTLQTCEYSEDCFSKKLTYVIDNVAGGMENAITATGTLRDFWDSFLENEKYHKQ